MTTGTDPITKIGTEVYGVRAVSGYIRSTAPDTVVLRQLYPGKPTDIGVIEAIASGTGEVTIHSAHCDAWTDHDRAALAAFFVPRYLERSDG
ncbi:hypothetical protein LO763_12215 [Glycomyces sp. A-F 0318]|uniref:hypothetical protein n=1 Tax=Glycomyces amatae TaxID=2881355 RepID=UPI001E30D4F6|nr:hypothetical protein [Glycomyces amatae]MCD0444387.1 hypothetical protein [Glycomyces amatae]